MEGAEENRAAELQPELQKAPVSEPGPSGSLESVSASERVKVNVKVDAAPAARVR